MSAIYDQFGRKIDPGDISFINNLVSLKAKSGSNPWPCIEAIIKFWAGKNRNKWKSYLLYLDDIKETRADRKYGSVHDKVNDGYLRYTLDIPMEIVYMIRCLYNADELPMDKQSGFFKEFAKRFPKFKIAEKM